MRRQLATILCDLAVAVLTLTAALAVKEREVYQAAICYGMAALCCAAGVLVQREVRPWWQDWRRG